MPLSDWTVAGGGTMESPAYRALAVTPHDTNALTFPARALYIGTAGHVVVITEGGDTATFSNVPVGILPVRCTHVKSTGTTALLIVALA